jgi:hypothetical protein
MSIDTKYNVGDKVWVADYERVNERLQCPDCLGRGIWLATLPSDEILKIPCPTCECGYQGSRGYVEGPYVYGPKVWQGTVGSIGVDTYASKEDERIKYMLCETGVGSGTLYDEGRLYSDEEMARLVAVSRANEQTEHLADQYIKGLLQKKKNRAGGLVAYLRSDRTRLMKQVEQIERHLASLGQDKTKVAS